MTSDHFRLCIHLDAAGRPCNRRTTKPLTLCALHRPKPSGSHTRPTPEQQRQSRAKRIRRRDAAGVPEGW